MREGLSFTAVRQDMKIDNNIKLLFDKIADIENIFGNMCYVVMGSDYGSPINELQPEDQEKLVDWIERNLDSSHVFNYCSK